VMCSLSKYKAFDRGHGALEVVKGESRPYKPVSAWCAIHTRGWGRGASRIVVPRAPYLL
jgi:hypothetical protein